MQDSPISEGALRESEVYPVDIYHRHIKRILFHDIAYCLTYYFTISRRHLTLGKISTWNLYYIFSMLTKKFCTKMRIIKSPNLIPAYYNAKIHEYKVKKMHHKFFIYMRENRKLNVTDSKSWLEREKKRENSSPGWTGKHRISRRIGARLQCRELDKMTQRRQEWVALFRMAMRFIKCESTMDRWGYGNSVIAVR